MSGWGFALVEAGPTVLGAGFLLVRGRRLGWLTCCGLGALPITVTAALLTGQPGFGLAQLGLHALVGCARLLRTTRNGPAEDRPGREARGSVSRLDARGRGSASRAEW